MRDQSEDTEGKPEGFVDLAAWKPGDGSRDGHGQVIRFVLSCRNEAKLAKWNRIQQTRENYDVYWGRHDFGHKIPGQSREVLAMQPMAVEQASSYFQQALIDIGGAWWRAASKNPKNADFLKISPATVYAITQSQLTKANFLRHVGGGVKSGLLGGLIITKVGGTYVDTPIYRAKRALLGKKAILHKTSKKVWQLKLDLVSQFNYYPDPTPSSEHDKLYEIEDMWMDYHEMIALAEGDDAIYDYDMCCKVERHADDDAEEKFDQMRRTNQNEVSHSFRGRVKITEHWGKILDTDGNVLHDNCVVTLANDKWLIREPTPNPLWHQQSPFVTTPILECPDAAWPKALADAATKYNIASNELFNLMLDGALRSVNGISQIRQDWLEDPAQVQNGIMPGTNLGVNSQCPPGAKVLEPLMSGEVPPDSLQLYNLLNQELNRAMLTSDIRQGIAPRNDVPATQIVAADQTISSMFKGMSVQIEQNWIQRVLEKSWMTCCEHIDDMDEAELHSLLEVDDVMKLTKLTPEEVFANTVHGVHFDVFGLSLTQQKAQDFRKATTLTQTIGASEPLMEAFVQKYDFGQYLEYIMRCLGMPTEQLERSHTEQALMAKQQADAQAQGGGAPAAPGSQPNQMSQVQSPTTGPQSEQLGSAASPQQQMATDVARGSYGGKRA
jgi:hypothetical protein